MSWDKPEEAAKRWEEEYSRDWKYFATDETAEYEGRKIQGLALPDPVLQQIFRENALRWVPGL
jgi:hypothetical protein